MLAARPGRNHRRGEALQSTGRRDLAESLRRRALFARTMLTHPRQVGAVWPTSRRAVNDLLDLADFGEARTVVEFGTGTGVYTREILNRLRPDGRFLSFELDAGLASAVSARLSDPRMRVINDSAEHAARYLEEYAGGARADILVSSVPFTSLPENLRDDIMRTAREILVPGGRMLVLQYSTAVVSDLRRFFGPVERRISPVNLPPAFLFACDNPGAEGS